MTNKRTLLSRIRNIALSPSKRYPTRSSHAAARRLSEPSPIGSSRRERASFEINHSESSQDEDACKKNKLSTPPPKTLDPEDEDSEEEMASPEEADQTENGGGDDLESEKCATRNEYYKLLKRNEFLGTRYPHPETMERLGIYDDVEYMFKQCSLNIHMFRPMEGYEEETVNFLSSVELFIYGESEDDGIRPDGSLGYLEFCVYDDQEQRIRSPVVRYFHRSLASALFARERNGTFDNGELELLETALQELLGLASDGTVLAGDQTDASVSFYLIEHLLSYRGWTKGLKKPGRMAMGGVATLILRACNVPLHSKQIPPRWIDMQHLINSKQFWSQQKNCLYKYRFDHPAAGQSIFLLLNSASTSIRDCGNIEFCPPVETLYTSGDEIKALNDKLDMILLSQQKHVHFLVDDEQYQVQDGEGNQLEEVSYINNQGFKDQVYPPHHQQGQNKPFVPYNQGFVPKQQSASTSAPKVTGLPGKSIQNPKEYANVHVITIMSRRELSTRERPKSVTKDSAYQDGEDFSLNEDQVDKPTEVLEPILDLDTRPTNPLTSSAALKLVAAKNSETSFIPPHKPPLPFPGRHKKELEDKYSAMFAKNIKEVELRIPLADALTRIPDSQKFLKDLIMETIQEVH
ncbi:hypothetical protein AXX17_AT4G07050 [Arabidopsis thaliana]|uniref:Arabidopsis retrotransposon Orf1 C-terminal domain-containing protein n=1 Tax=Arabidopsis thaliana TaxID=3702 RepID=A0A178UV46_ARATH|nr:hypothetical protein AXX17_AT4G07050 [Arabidopsis thaliana]